jgi:hypothetical protein
VNHTQPESSTISGDLKVMAERELRAFVRAVTELFGSEQARLSAADWLDEFESANVPGTSRDWRPVTTAAASRLASRVNQGANHKERTVPPGRLSWHEQGNTNWHLSTAFRNAPEIL